MNDTQARSWAMGCHLAALAFYVGIPFGNLLGPLIIWLLKRNEFALVDEQGKEALNFQISITIYAIVGVVLTVIFAISLIMIPVAVILGICLGLLFLFNLIIVIIAAVKVSSGEPFKYPLTIQFLK